MINVSLKEETFEEYINRLKEDVDGDPEYAILPILTDEEYQLVKKLGDDIILNNNIDEIWDDVRPNTKFVKKLLIRLKKEGFSDFKIGYIFEDLITQIADASLEKDKEMISMSESLKAYS